MTDFRKLGKGVAGALTRAKEIAAAEREANLQKFLEPSKTQMRLYHGTTATEGGKGQEAIRRIKPSKEGALGSGVYMTPKTAHASGYTGIPNDEAIEAMRGTPYYDKMAEQFMADRAAGTLREGQEGGNMLPVFAQIKNPLIIGQSGRNIDPAADALISLGMDEESAIRLVEKAFEEKGNIGKQIQSRAQAQGYDGLMQYRNGDLSEVVSYNPNAVKSAIGNQGTYDIYSPDLSKARGGGVHMVDGGKMAKGVMGALTKAQEIAKARKAADMMPTARINLPAPNILIPSKLNNVREAVRNMKGNYGARRVERAADEIPNLERMYQEDALKEAFTGDNARGVMTMNPADFEKYSAPLDPRFMSEHSTRYTTSGERLAYPDYMKDYLPNVGAFSDVPYLNLFKDEVGLPTKASIIGHEGRHRNRVLTDKGETAALVQVNPRGDLREGMPRRTQEDFIEALKEELDSANRLVLPEKYLDNFSQKDIKRPAIDLPDIYAEGGGVKHMAKAGRVGDIVEGGLSVINKAKEIAKARKAENAASEITPEIEAVIKAADRAAAGRKAADVAKATAPMKLSEALGNMNLEGKGKLKITQADRTRVGGGNIGGPMFSGLQQIDPIYDQAAWGVGKKSTASAMINDSDPNTLWTTVLGSADQLKSNPIVFNKLRKGFTDSMKAGNLSPELEAKINHNLALTFGEGADIRDPKIWNMANTYEKRGALADLLLGQGIAPSKGGVALGGEKSGKGVIFQPSEILKRETEPMLLHPEHGGDVPTFAVGPRLFNLSGETMTRPDLHPGYPVILKGEDMGVVFEPVAGKEAMPEFVKQYKNVKGREPTGYFDWTKGLVGEGAPSQPITEEYLTYLQKLNKKDGGKVEEPHWHKVFNRKMKEGGYAWVDDKHIPKVRSLKRMAKGGSSDEPKEPTFSEYVQYVPEAIGDFTKKEAESFKKPRAVSDVMYRGIVANNPVSVGVDMVNAGLMGVDALTGMMGKPTRLSSEKPFAGSEHVKDLMDKYGVTSGEERPISETLLGIFSPTGMVKGAVNAGKAMQKSGTAIKDMVGASPKKARGGLTLMR